MTPSLSKGALPEQILGQADPPSAREKVPLCAESVAGIDYFRYSNSVKLASTRAMKVLDLKFQTVNRECTTRPPSSPPAASLMVSANVSGSPHSERYIEEFQTGSLFANNESLVAMAKLLSDSANGIKPQAILFVSSRGRKFRRGVLRTRDDGPELSEYFLKLSRGNGSTS